MSVPFRPTGSQLRLAIIADPLSQQGTEMQADAPACDVCGSITVRSGTCYKCLNCGNSMGCSLPRVRVMYAAGPRKRPGGFVRLQGLR